MARIAGVDLPPAKRAEVGLTYIYGIGRTRSKSLLYRAGIDFDKKSRRPDRGRGQPASARSWKKKAPSKATCARKSR